MKHPIGKHNPLNLEMAHTFQFQSTVKRLMQLSYIPDTKMRKREFQSYLKVLLTQIKTYKMMRKHP